VASGAKTSSRAASEYVGGSDQDALRHRARWQRLAGKQTQGERHNIVTVAVHVVATKPGTALPRLLGSISFFSLAPPWMFGSSPWLTMMQSLCRRFISMAFLAYTAARSSRVAINSRWSRCVCRNFANSASARADCPPVQGPPHCKTRVKL
jgi:hypothetical protein